ncbi:MAG: UDP-N-acetylmuramate dehydrogenase [Bacillota bacterium]|nr:UDP-N-acetylmuramate dehydrogenase [Bacillota bacterium]
MNQKIEFGLKLQKLLNIENIKIDEPMKKHTSFKVGGPADYLLTPESFDQLKGLISLCNSYSVPYYIIGNGTNLLVRDGGIRGVVIKLTKLNKVSVNGEYIKAECGASLNSVAKETLKYNLTGFEFASGIPGSVGGAVTMNAGAYNGEMSHIIESALVLDKDGNINTISNKDLELSYRMSAILKYNYIVLEALFKLTKGEKYKIKGRIDELTHLRKEKQPLEYASAGSTFKRPVGHFAAKLIDDCNLRGESVGDAEVSTKHTGFIINKGGASAKDILKLISIVQKSVKDKFDVDLYTEVLIIGED